MGNAQEYVPGLVVFLLDPRLYRVDERRVAGAVTLHQFTGTLVDDDQVVVVIHYFHIASLPSGIVDGTAKLLNTDEMSGKMRGEIKKNVTKCVNG